MFARGGSSDSSPAPGFLLLAAETACVAAIVPDVLSRIGGAPAVRFQHFRQLLTVSQGAVEGLGGFRLDTTPRASKTS